MSNKYTVRVHFLSGETRIVEAKDIHWVGEEGARSGIAVWEGKEYPIYNRSDQPDAGMWEEQMETHPGVCLQCERESLVLSPAGLCLGCVMEAQGEGM